MKVHKSLKAALRMLNPSRWVVWAAMFFGILPLAWAPTLDMAYSHDAISQEKYLSMLWVFNTLGAPGEGIAAFFDEYPHFWTSHSRGGVFWKHLALFLVANTSGYLGIALSIETLRISFLRLLNRQKLRRGDPRNRTS